MDEVAGGVVVVLLPPVGFGLVGCGFCFLAPSCVMLTVFDKLPETTLKEVERFCVFVLAETVTVTVLPFVESVTHFSWEYGLFHFPEEAFTVTLLLPPFSAKDKVCGVISRVGLGAGLFVGFWAGLGVGSDLADLLFLQSAMRFSMSES